MVEKNGESHLEEVPGDATRQQVASPQTTLCRILVVEDFAPFRRFICSTLATMPGIQVVGEAVDGLEAVQKAADLKPDLILLDIGLPTLNGLECARRIRMLAPQCKIIFLSQESCADVVREALTLACGYVLKTRATRELLTAIESARSERQFVGTM
jgi:DNA-binding NarL/FixJ family response regulator